MANFTKRAIKESFIKLLNSRPLSQITVKDIVTDCGVNRNTFYYYFEDIPMLIEDIVMEDVEDLVRQYPTVEKLDEAILSVIDTALAKRRAVLHIYNSVNREIYEKYLWQVCDHVVEAYVNTLLQGKRVRPEDVRIVKQYLKWLGFGLASGWLSSGMSENVRADFARLCELKRGMVEEMLRRCEIG